MTAPLLLHVFSTFAVGGPQMRFAMVANRLGSDFRHAVVAMDGRDEARTLLDPGLDVVFPEVGVAKGELIGNLRRFRGAIRALGPDLLVTSNWGSIEWALARQGFGVPHLHMEDGFGPEERSAQLWRRVFARRVLLRQVTVAVPSRVLWRIARDAWRLPESRLRLIPNGVDLARFAAAPARSGGDGAPVVIGTVAALRAEKNIARLIRAFARIPPEIQARLVIVGDGPERPALEALAATEGVAERTRFAGHAADPAPHFASFDIFALSSDTEQMPISVLEAMAAGLPVAATDVGDVAAMLDASNGPLVVARQEDALALALTALAGDAGLRRRLGAANRARAEAQYDVAGMVAAWGGLFAGLALRR